LNQRRPKKQFRQISEMVLRIPELVAKDSTSPGRQIYICFADDDDLLSPLRNYCFTSSFSDECRNPFTTFKYPHKLVTHNSTCRIITCEDVNGEIEKGTIEVVQTYDGRNKSIPVGEIHTTFVSLQALQMFFKENESMLDNLFCDQFFLLYLHRQHGSETIWIMLADDAPWKWAYFYRNDDSYPRVTRPVIDDLYESLQVIVDASNVDTIKEGTVRQIWKSLRNEYSTFCKLLPENAPIDVIAQLATALLKHRNVRKRKE
jgi:hypothetical protein